MGTISVPVSGTKIAPGQAFNFTYNAHADYCKSSYDYSVWVVTQAPTNVSFSETFMSGYHFGTYQEPNYPAVPYPSNPAPAQLVMPDFSKNQGGFGAGQNATNANFYLMVMEQWDDCQASASLTANHIIYNATASTKH
ncbi:hypothetical protein BV25DRAFT_1872905 [Artomyces pyxidatus]|uniref:Uncharacterized protein n=1 Tax=Artomyces pyxidatus TaxID=48021 RepID=A0ACB8SIM4_9AGAM|nr:hypothetical protein BV25DRAFT_1872905 [Artomyces pyxidatus]